MTGGASNTSRAGMLTTAIVLVALVALWELAVRGFGVKPIVLPAPSDIGAELAANLPWYLGHAWYTLLTTLAGFAVAVVVGIALAVVVVESRLLESTVYALIVGLNSVPKVAVAPLFVVWLGTGYEPKIAIAFLIAVFAMVIDTVLGLRSVPTDVIDLARSLRGSRLDVLLRIKFPCALPAIFSGMKVAISLALVGAIVGEFVSSQRGLGYVILSAQGMFDIPRVFAALVVLAALGIALFWAIVWAERRSIPWHASQSEAARIGA
jgi:NitT/TauT family transport system permease protein